jgi:hypothetical protein
MTCIISSCSNKGKKKITFNSEIPPFSRGDVSTSYATEAGSSLFKWLPSNVNSSLPAFKRVSCLSIYWKSPFQREFQKKPNASCRNLIEIFSTFFLWIFRRTTPRDVKTSQLLLAYLLKLRKS